MAMGQRHGFRARYLLFAAAWLLAGSVGRSPARSPAQSPAPTFTPGPPSPGTIRIWGDEYMSSVVQAWEAGFAAFHPEIKFEVHLMGTATAMPAIYGGVADLALLGRESNTTDNDGFLHSLQYKPMSFELMTGSLDVPRKAPALVLYVHRGNPLAHISLAQLEGAFGCPGGRAGTHVHAITTWGDLGLGGEWRDRPVHLYGYDAETGTGLFFSRVVLHGSRKRNWASLREFKDIDRPDGSRYDAGQQIVDALSRDPYGLAVSTLRYATPEVKALAVGVAAADGAEPKHFYAATAQTVIDGTYPLARMTYAFVNQPPGQPMNAKVREFLRYVFSREGQADVAGTHGYLPLREGLRAAQIEKLR